MAKMTICNALRDLDSFTAELLPVSKLIASDLDELFLHRYTDQFFEVTRSDDENLLVEGTRLEIQQFKIDVQDFCESSECAVVPVLVEVFFSFFVLEVFFLFLDATFSKKPLIYGGWLFGIARTQF